MKTRALPKRFREFYGAAPAAVFRAPGRVNLIGEHTDYNGGYVMPSAIDLSARAAVAPAAGRVTVHSLLMEDTVTVDLGANAPPARSIHSEPAGRHWSDYIRGVIAVLLTAGCRLRGANIMIASEVPPGSGLSSSAAIEVAVAYALVANSELAIDPKQIALLCQEAENRYAGARCGIMDQFTSCLGRTDHAILLDCRSLGFRYLPLPESVTMAVSNTMVRHELASGEYNRRRQECEEGVRALRKCDPAIESLRDVTFEQLSSFQRALDATIYRRCLHVVTENQRTLAAAAALESGNLDGFGSLMFRSHESLRDDYEVSCPELDVMVDLAMREPGVYGSRMMGGGFGGCTISLVESDHAEAFRQHLAEAYARETGIHPAIYVLSAVDGASQEELLEQVRDDA
jgi:galactokinase